MILRKQIHYEYLDDIHIRHDKVVRFRALKNGISAYHDRYIWSGEGPVAIKPIIQGQVFRDTGNVSGWNCYSIDLDRTLRKGEECEVELAWDLIDEGRRARPFLATTIREPTNRLELKVTVPGMAGKQAICEIRSNGSVLQASKTQYISFDRHNTAVWTLSDPKLLHHYQVRWHT